MLTLSAKRLATQTLQQAMDRHRHRVDLRDFLEREVPVSRLSPDLRQRVRHALAGHGDLFAVTAEVVRELLNCGELRRAGTVRDNGERVVVYGLSRSPRVFDLRTLLEPSTDAPKDTKAALKSTAARTTESHNCWPLSECVARTGSRSRARRRFRSHTRISSTTWSEWA